MDYVRLQGDGMGFKAWAVAHVPDRYHVPLRYWYRFMAGRLEKELRLVKQVIFRGGVTLDIGANNGVYTYALSPLSRRVEAFEPVPACARTLEAFRATNVRVHEVALSSSNGAGQMYVPLKGGLADTALASFSRPPGSFETIPVAVRRLDEYGFDHVSFIKIDVEGHELDVLRGARETIERCSPVLLIEIEQRHLGFPIDLVFDEVGRLGYRGFFLDRGRATALSEFSFETHQEPFLQDVLSPNYVNNFIFIHERSKLRWKPEW